LTGTLTFRIGTLEEALDHFEAAWNGAYDGPIHRYDYPSYEAFYKGLAPNRMAILRTMMGQGPLSIREIARRVGRDFKGVHSDVSSMFTAGLLYKAEDGRMVFPFDQIRVDFGLGPTATRPAA
jgi:predicted transcriptional regulator